jgi:thiamine pyrophosphokinase
LRLQDEFIEDKKLIQESSEDQLTGDSCVCLSQTLLEGTGLLLGCGACGPLRLDVVLQQAILLVALE